MPLVEPSNYRPPFCFRNGHIQTIFASQFRKVEPPEYRRERIDTPDGDFLDLDWAASGQKNLLILSHGLEGNTGRRYIAGMVRAANESGWDALAWNYRSCSGEVNRNLGFYHNGSTGDLDVVVRHAKKNGRYRKIALVGYSLGGNLTMNYLAEKGASAAKSIERAVVFSVPFDLKSSSEKLANFGNKIYMVRFLRTLHKKIKAKMELYPDQLNDKDYHSIKNFKQYDDRYTAPLHGFESAEDYWEKCSSHYKLHRIKVPVLVINPLNDPMLDAPSYPFEQARKSKYLYLETPHSGGHCGFVQFQKNKRYYSEERALEFLEEKNS